MANLVYNEGKKRLLGALVGATNLSALSAMLVKSTYVANADHAAVDDGTADDPKSHELTVGGYARVALAGIANDKDTTGDFGYLDAADAAFGALATGETIGGLVVFYDTGNDTTAVPILFFDLADTPTNGSNITVRWADIAQGALLKAA
jgi:hypothetical protein